MIPPYPRHTGPAADVARTGRTCAWCGETTTAPGYIVAGRFYDTVGCMQLGRKETDAELARVRAAAEQARVDRLSARNGRRVYRERPRDEDQP